MSHSDLLPLLTTLFESGSRFVQTTKGEASENIVQTVLQNRAGASIGKLEDLHALLKDKPTFSTTDPPRYLRLHDVEEGGCRLTPLVYLDGDLARNSAYLRVQVAIIVHSGPGCENPKKFGLRFETPEDTIGKHDYYHSQVCREVRRGTSVSAIDLGLELEWFPTSHPAWPLDADTPAELMACLILALYGKVEGSKIIRAAGEAAGRDFFAEVLGDMRTRFRPAAKKVGQEQRRRGARGSGRKRRSR